MNTLSDKSFWDSVWSNNNADLTNKILFADIFNRYLEIDPTVKCIEIGCVPGRFLVYLHNKFEYQISGLDYSEHIDAMSNMFRNNGIDSYRLIKADFTKFDVVCSFGFIEHFDNYKEVFSRHVNLLKPKGILIITVPNLRYLQYFLHRIFYKSSLAKHNLEVMDKYVMDALCNENNLSVKYLSYYETFKFWISNPHEHSLISLFFMIPIALILRTLNLLVNLPNKYTSPYLILVAQKQ